MVLPWKTCKGPPRINNKEKDYVLLGRPIRRGNKRSGRLKSRDPRVFEAFIGARIIF